MNFNLLAHIGIEICSISIQANMNKEQGLKAQGGMPEGFDGTQASRILGAQHIQAAPQDTQITRREAEKQEAASTSFHPCSKHILFCPSESSV